MTIEKSESHIDCIRAIEVPEKNMHLRIAVAYTDKEVAIRKNIMENMQMPNQKFPVREVEVNGVWLLIEENQLIIHNEPTMRSVGSQARYIAESIFRSPGILIQTIGEGEVSSDHMHRFRSERFELLTGQAEVKVHSEKIELKVDRPLDVSPKTFHEISGGEGGAIVLLIIRGEGDCLNKDDYIYRKRGEVHLPLS